MFHQFCNATRPAQGSSNRRPARPAVEALEDRCVPAIVVNTLADTLDLNPNVTSLREAINVAQAQVGDDVITFLPGLTGTIQLTSALATLTSNVDIQGPGAGLLTVARSGAPGTPNFQIFAVNATVTLSGLTISNGNITASGGGIRNSGTLTLTNSTLSGNSAGDGGGLYNTGTLTLSNSTLSANKAVGGGLLSGNGGGLANFGTLTLTNSTLSGNTAVGSGGGLANFGSATLTNATLTGNRAGAAATGGGIRNNGTLTLHNTIVAGNFKGTGTALDDVFGAIGTVSSFNLIGNGTGLTGIGNSNGNQVGTALAPIDPRLGPLQFNGGPTATHALLSDSPALNRGLSPNAPFADQRGVGRSGAPDIGAFEFQPPPPAPQSLSASLVTVRQKKSRKRRLKVVVRYADTGAVKAEFNSPFQKGAYKKIAVLALDTDSDGITDSVQIKAVKVGLRKRKVSRTISV